MIISEVFIREDGSETIDRSFNRIISEYKKHFDRIDVVGPCGIDILASKGSFEGVYYTGTTKYSKSIKNRLKYVLSQKKTTQYFDSLIRNLAPDVIQVRIPSMFASGAFRAVRRSRKEITSYVAGDWYTSFISNYSFWGNKFIAKVLDRQQVDVIENSVCVSAGPELARKYKSIAEVYPYFSTTHDEVKRVEKDYRELNFLSVGRLESQKRVEDAIYALSLLKNRIPDRKFTFTVCGEGKSRGDLESLCKDLGLEHHVNFVGYIQDDDTISKLYQKAHILLFPSVSEGTPKVLAEAMSHGTVPIAVRTTGSIRYIINNNENGYLVEAHSPEGIFKSINNFICNEKNRDDLVNGCYRYAQEHTIVREVEKMWLHIFDRLETKK